MAQFVRVECYRAHSLSQCLVRRVVACLSALRSMPGERGILVMFTCLLLWRAAFAAMPEEVRRFDHHNDGRPDQWEVYRDGVLIGGAVDRNRDGRVDEWTFCAGGQVVRAEFDTDADGKVNQREFCNAERQVERVEVDRDGDGRMEQRLFYGPGKTLLRAEVDADGDGQPEQWHTFQDGHLQDIALDTNHDGRPNQWHHYRPSGELAFVEVDSAATGKVDR